MKRTAVFVFWDGSGVADDYVGVLLGALREHCQRIVCMVNGELDDPSRALLESRCDVLIRRPNAGLDITAYKEGFFYVRENPMEEEEILFLNATVFGPVYPLGEMFGRMEARTELDFWGLTRYCGSSEDLWGLNGLGYIPPHIQSYFWAVRRSLFTSQAFERWWQKLPEIHSYQEAVSFHEMVFTRHFEELGYRWDTYIQSDGYDKFDPYPLMGDPTRLLREQRCPLVKRKSFLMDRTELTMPVSGDAGRELYEYLRDETGYDVSLIAQNIARTENNFDYSMALGLLVPLAVGCGPGRGDTAAVYWVSDAQALPRLAALRLPEGCRVLLYCSGSVHADAARAQFPSAVIREVGDTPQQVFGAARTDAAGARYVLYFHCDPRVTDSDPGLAPRQSLDLPMLIHASKLVRRTENAFQLLDRDPGTAAVVLLPLTHRAYFSSNPVWADWREHQLAGLGRWKLAGLGKEPLCVPGCAFVARGDCFARVCEMTEAVTFTDARDPQGYLVPLAAQSLGRFVAFFAGEQVLRSQVFTEYTQIHNLTSFLAAEDVRRSDQITVCARVAMRFFHNFFSKRTLRDRLYFARLALLPRSRFLRLEKLLHRGAAPCYPYDCYGVDKR